MTTTNLYIMVDHITCCKHLQKDSRCVAMLALGMPNLGIVNRKLVNGLIVNGLIVNVLVVTVW